MVGFVVMTNGEGGNREEEVDVRVCAVAVCWIVYGGFGKASGFWHKIPGLGVAEQKKCE